MTANPPPPDGPSPEKPPRFRLSISRTLTLGLSLLFLASLGTSLWFAIDAAHQMSRDEGLFVGISSGANVLAAKQVAAELGPGKTIVTVLCDRGERYLSVDT